MAPLIAQFGDLFFILVAFVAALSVIVAIHEYGHYIVGRWCGIKAEIFSLGFGPVLFSRVDRHGTRWQVAALPFGGYVKFLGDGNAASGTSDGTAAQMTPEMRRQTMIYAPLWARTLTVAAGPVFNFVLSILIFGAVMLGQGKVEPPFVIDRVQPLPVDGVELRPGDELVAVAGQPFPDMTDPDLDFLAYTEALPPDPVLTYDVRRDGTLTQVQGPHLSPILVSSLVPRSAAIDAGIRQGDVIVSVDGVPVTVFDELRQVVEGSDGRALALQVWRDGETLDLTLTPRRSDEPSEEGGFETHWRIGISGGLPFELETSSHGLGEAAGDAVAQTWAVITGSVSGLYHMVTGAISSCNMSGPIGIAEVSGNMASQGVDSFIWFIAVLSTAVGLLNLFPIPVLDGGHLVFYAYEAVAGRAPSERALRVMMSLGLTLILGVMAFALFNDIFCP
ncbi:MAG: RIP metalloprotease RseP [Pseudomonadota bacterium]